MVMVVLSWVWLCCRGNGGVVMLVVVLSWCWLCCHGDGGGVRFVDGDGVRDVLMMVWRWV